IAALTQAGLSGKDQCLIDVAGGKGVAGCDLASALGCAVVVCDRYPPVLADSEARVRRLGLADRVAVVAADGQRLPLRDGSVAAATCIGAASIIGIPRIFEELARVVRRGGLVVVSDVVWRERPIGPVGSEWGEPPAEIQHALPEYLSVMAAAGLQAEATHQHPYSDWEDYIAPIMEVAREARASGEGEFADELEEGFAVELRWAAAYWDYVTIVARRAS
ncbi:MAG TPA: methyltransferase domain-containing protein, partial [Dehalococcoidia bacterium]|nr:methyltransferase domain-containing protein [Dehalococcoidia bacterium]